MTAYYGYGYAEEKGGSTYAGIDIIKSSDDWYNALGIALDWAMKASRKNPTRIYAVSDRQVIRNANRTALIVNGVITKYEQAFPVEAVKVGEPVTVEWWKVERTERTLVEKSRIWGLHPRPNGNYKLLERHVRYIKVIFADESTMFVNPVSGAVWDGNVEAEWDEQITKNRAYDAESVISVENARRVYLYDYKPDRKQEDWDDWINKTALWNACLYQTVTGKQAPLAGSAVPQSLKAGDTVVTAFHKVFTKKQLATYEVVSVWLDGRVLLHDGSIVPYFAMRKVE